MKKVKTTLNLFGALIMTIGFMTLFSNVLENLSGVIAIISLPLLIGALLLNNKEFEKEGLWFLFSSIFIIVGFLFLFGTSPQDNFSRYASIGLINLGAFIFSLSLLNLWEKVGDKLYKERIKK